LAYAGRNNPGGKRIDRGILFTVSVIFCLKVFKVQLNIILIKKEGLH